MENKYLFLNKEIKDQLIISKEASSFLDWLLDNEIPPSLMITKSEHTNGTPCYICDISISSVSDYETNVGDGITEIDAISNAVENIYFNVDANFKSLFPYAYRHLIKPDWYQITINKAPSIINEMKQNKIILNLKYDYIQNGNDKDGNPLWICNVYAEVYKCYGDNYKINLRGITPHYSKLQARIFASLSLLAEILDKYNCVL